MLLKMLDKEQDKTLEQQFKQRKKRLVMQQHRLIMLVAVQFHRPQVVLPLIANLLQQQVEQIMQLAKHYLL